MVNGDSGQNGQSVPQHACLEQPREVETVATPHLLEVVWIVSESSLRQRYAMSLNSVQVWQIYLVLFVASKAKQVFSS